MSNKRTKLHRMLINPPVIPSGSNLEHKGTAFQISKSTDFTNKEAMVAEGSVYKEDGSNILLIENKITIGLDDVIYSRYAYIFGPKGEVQPDRDNYTINQWSRMSSSHGDQVGYKFDSTVLNTPVLEIKELIGTSTLSGYQITISGYEVLVGDKSEHKYTSWEISNSNNEIIYQRSKDEDNLDKLILDKNMFNKNELYFIRAKVISATNAESNWGCIIFNPNILANDDFELKFLEPFYLGMNLFMRLKVYTTQATKIKLVVKEVAGDFESRTVLDKEEPLSRSLSIPNTTFERDKTYRLYACLKYNDGRYGPLSLIREFVVKVNNLYPNRADSNYNQQGHIFQFPGISTGQGVVNSRELRDGSFILGVNSEAVAIPGQSHNDFILYAKYGDSIRTTDIKIKLPEGAPSIAGNDLNYPIVNVLPLYDDRVIINYCTYSQDHYKKSVWVIYSVDWIKKKYTPLGYKVFDDEGLSTAVSSSAVVCRDNSIIYIPALFYKLRPGVKIKQFTSPTQLDLENRTWKASDNSVNFTWPAPDGKVAVSLSEDLKGIKVNTTQNNLDSSPMLDLWNIKNKPTNNKDGITLGVRVRIPLDSSNNIPGDNYPPLLCVTGPSKSKLLSLGIDKSDSHTRRKITLDMHNTLMGDDFGRPTQFPTEVPLNKDYFDIVITAYGGKYCKVYINGTLVRNINNATSPDQHDSIPSNPQMNSWRHVFLGTSLAMGNGSTFEFKDFFFLDVFTSDEEVSGGFDKLLKGAREGITLDLPLCKLTHNPDGGTGEAFNRTIIKDTIKPTIKRHITICPLNDLPIGGEQFLVLGGTTDEAHNSTSVGDSSPIPGMFYYELDNLTTYTYTPSNNTLTENDSSKHLPASIQTQDRNGAYSDESAQSEKDRVLKSASIYNIAAFRRADGKIVLFNNSDVTRIGGEATDTRTWLMDWSKTGDEFCKSQNNDTNIDMPFRSTIALRDGSFLRVGNTLTTMPPLLGYMAEPVSGGDSSGIISNKHLVVKARQKLAIDNPYVYETIVIEGTSEEDSGILTWNKSNHSITFTYVDRIITRDLVETQAEADSKNKERVHVLAGVKYEIKD